MGLAPKKEFCKDILKISSCLVTNSVTHNNGRCYINIAYIITPPPLKSSLSSRYRYSYSFLVLSQCSITAEKLKNILGWIVMT